MVDSKRVGFRYKIRKKRPNMPSRPRVPRLEEKEFFTKVVRGLKASDLEERFARSLDKMGKSYMFRYRIPAFPGAPIANMTGEVEVDFLIIEGLLTPIFIDGEFSHKGWTQKEIDLEKTRKADEYFRQYNANPSIRISHIFLQSQAMSDIKARELLG